MGAGFTATNPTLSAILTLASRTDWTRRPSGCTRETTGSVRRSIETVTEGLEGQLQALTSPQRAAYARAARSPSSRQAVDAASAIAAGYAAALGGSHTPAAVLSADTAQLQLNRSVPHELRACLRRTNHASTKLGSAHLESLTAKVGQLHPNHLPRKFRFPALEAPGQELSSQDYRGCETTVGPRPTPSRRSDPVAPPAAIAHGTRRGISISSVLSSAEISAGATSRHQNPCWAGRAIRISELIPYPPSCRSPA
jgi:hypothetical protein